MRIAIDAMGGDNAPKAAVEGAVQAVMEYGVEICLVGKQAEINKYLSESDKNNNKSVVTRFFYALLSKPINSKCF
jgi:glycerol-3-phosphate acyltransferase PlsX